MKIISDKPSFQGDVWIQVVGELPDDVQEQPQGDQVIVAHSETGHHHAIDNTGKNVWLYSSKDQMVSYLRVKGYADVVHHRDYDTHEAFRLPEGIVKITRQREWSPEGWKRVED